MTRLTELEYAEILCRRQGKIPNMPNIPPPPKPLKFRNRKTEVDGITFDSKREATRYQDLKVAERCGLISDLKLQVSYPLEVNSVLIGRYVCDFEYIEEGKKVVEDTKSEYTRKLMWYRMKKKLMLAIYGIEIRET